MMRLKALETDYVCVVELEVRQTAGTLVMA